MDLAVKDIKRLEDLPPVLTPIEVAAVVKLCKKQVYTLIYGGRLRATNISGAADGPGPSGASCAGKSKGKRAAWRVMREDLISYLHGDTNQGAIDRADRVDRASRGKAA